MTTRASLAAALRACVHVGGELEAAARNVLADLCAASRDTFDLASRLGCSERNARSVLQAFGTTFDTAIADLTNARRAA